MEITFVDDSPAKKTCRKSWRQLIYKIYEVDPLRCPNCGTDMKIIAFIQEREQIIKILKHLKIWPIEYPEPPQGLPLYMPGCSPNWQLLVI
ncbi:hypothetical protein KA005_44375 [bacterium]|nr:hypothetical protein [bacterium]